MFWPDLDEIEALFFIDIGFSLVGVIGVGFPSVGVAGIFCTTGMDDDLVSPTSRFFIGITTKKSNKYETKPWHIWRGPQCYDAFNSRLVC